MRQSFHTGHQLGCQTTAVSWNCMGTLWLRERSKEALVSILNYFVCPVPSLLLADLFKFSRGTKWNTLEATLHPQLSPCKDLVSQTKHFALKVFIALMLPGRDVFHQQPKTGARTAPALGFLSPPSTPGCLTGDGVMASPVSAGEGEQARMGGRHCLSLPLKPPSSHFTL